MNWGVGNGIGRVEHVERVEGESGGLTDWEIDGLEDCGIDGLEDWEIDGLTD